jgi:hypothetical protein
MSSQRSRQRGEGKIGCIISLLVFLLLGAVAFKIVPFWWSMDQLASTADELASRAGMLNQETVLSQMKAKARDLELPEALAPGAMSVAMTGGGTDGTCTITIRFSRDIDFYGITKYKWGMDKRITKPWGRY